MCFIFILHTEHRSENHNVLYVRTYLNNIFQHNILLDNLLSPEVSYLPNRYESSLVFNVSLKHTISPTFAKSWTNWIKSHHYLHSSLSLHFSDKRVYCRSLIAAVTARWVKKTRLINHPPVPRQRILNPGRVQIVPRATTSDPDPPPFQTAHRPGRQL